MAAPAEIGKYRILRELGRGAMGAVYLAEDPFIARRVAIKVMRPQVEEGEERFLQEARTIGSLSHPNIVLLHDFGFAGELPYLVMEHVEGTILDRWLSEPHGAEARLRVLAGLCRAVTYAHSRGVLHRDLKPSNVLVRSDGEAKLLDFGIARVENTRMTATGVVLGTPEYLAPELLGSGKFSPRSDMYALGLVAYELFGGRNPFGADTVAACLRRVLEVEPAPLAAFSSAPAGVATEVMRCLAKDPQVRPESPERLLAAIGGVERVERAEPALAAGPAPAPGPAIATSPTTRMETGTTEARPKGRTRPLRWIAAAVLVAAGLGAAYWLLGPPPAPPPESREKARETADRPAGSSRDDGPPIPVAPAAVVSTDPVTASIPPPPSRTLASEAKSAASPARSAVSPLPAAGDASSASPVETPAGAPALEEIVARPTPAESAPAPAATATPTAPPETPPQGSAVVPAPAVLSESPSGAPPTVAPRLISIAPKSLRRGAGVTVRLRVEPLLDGWSVQFRRGGKSTSQIRVLRSKRTGATDLELSVLPEEDAPIGTYALVLVDASGKITNALSLEVDL